MELYARYLSNFKAQYYMYISLSVIFQSCLGSIAAMFILMNGNEPIFLVQLFLCICVSMAYNASVLAQLKPKIVFNLLLLSIFTNLTLIIVSALSW